MSKSEPREDCYSGLRSHKPYKKSSAAVPTTVRRSNRNRAQKKEFPSPPPSPKRKRSKQQRDNLHQQILKSANLHELVTRIVSAKKNRRANEASAKETTGSKVSSPEKKETSSSGSKVHYHARNSTKELLNSIGSRSLENVLQLARVFESNEELPSGSGESLGEPVTVGKAAGSASAGTPTKMSSTSPVSGRNQRRERQSGVNLWEPKVRRTAGGSLDKEIKAAEELDRRVQEFRSFLKEMALSSEVQGCCDRILQAVEVIREESDSTRKKNVSLRKIIKNLRHSKTETSEEGIIETKNKLLEEKVLAEIQMELQARTIHEQAERIRALELQLQEKQRDTKFWSLLDDADTSQPCSGSPSAISEGNYAELRPLSGALVMNESDPACLTPLQTVPVNNTDNYNPQVFFDDILAQDHPEDNNNAWTVSPENSWMMKC